MRDRVLRFLIAVPLFVGCFGDETLVFPPGLEPAAEVHEAPFPEGDVDTPFPERLELIRTTAENARQTPPSVHGSAYVQAPLSDVWEALRNPDVSADRRAFDAYEVENDVEPEYDYSYRIDATINNIITVEYSTNFRHGVIEGTLDAPLAVAVAWQKTEGSTIIAELRGSIIARAVTEDVTSLEMIQYGRTAMSNHEDNETYLTDVFEATVALTDGQPLPDVD